jgi:hypothetical protein
LLEKKKILDCNDLATFSFLFLSSRGDPRREGGAVSFYPECP